MFFVLVFVRGSIQTTDGIAYAELADSLLQGEAYDNFYWCPGYPVFMAAVKWLGGKNFLWTGAVIQYAILAGGAWLISSLVKQHPIQRWLVFSLILLSPQLVNHAGKIRNETVCLGLVSAAAYILASKPDSSARVIAAALVLAASVHVRNSDLAIAAGLGLWILLYAGASWKSRLGRSALFASVILVALAPWCWYATQQLGEFTFVSANMRRNIKGTDHSLGQMINVHRQWNQCLTFFYYWIPFPIPKGVPAGKWLANSLTMWLMTPGFVLAAVSWLRWKRQDPVLAMAIVVPLVYVIGLTLCWPELRYRFIVDPLIVLAVVSGCATCWTSAGSNEKTKSPTTVIREAAV